jgi:5-methylcytosine-specific restriction endonuclease McrA
MPSPRPKRVPRAPRQGQSTYGRRWGRVRDIVLRDARGRCKDCGRLAQEVHHVVPIRYGGQAYDLANLVPLCRLCHDARHGGRARRS